MERQTTPAPTQAIPAHKPVPPHPGARGRRSRVVPKGNSNHHPKRDASDSGLIVGTLVALDSSMVPLVDHPGNTTGSLLPAKSLVNLGQDEIGREVALMFEGEYPARPVVMGLIQPAAFPPSGVESAIPQLETPPIVVESDGKRLVLAAEKEIVLRCGEASITLTRAGKVLIRGTYVVSRSTGANCVRGATIQLN